MTRTSRGLMEGINMEKSSHGCYKAIQIGFVTAITKTLLTFKQIAVFKGGVSCNNCSFFMSNGSKSWCWKPPKLSFQINQIAFRSSPLMHTVALKGHHYISFSLHYINFDLCEKKLCDYVYIIVLHVYIIILHVYIIILHVYIIICTCIHNYLGCIHNYLYMYT